MDREQSASSGADSAARLEDFKQACRLREESARQPGNSIHQAWHDLKECLHVIQIAGLLLKSKAADDDTRNVAEYLMSASGDMQQLLADLPDFARLEAGRETRSLSQFDVTHLCREVVDNLSAVAQAKGCILTLKPTPLTVQGDVTKLQRVVGNLIRYCIKYVKPGEIILAWRAQPANRWLLTLSAMPPKGGENEMSIPPERIGLTVARGFCKVLGGELTVELAPGGGVFRIELPMDYPAN